MDILKNFGFDPVLFGAQIVNFLIILYLLHRFALKPILALLDERKKGVEQIQEDIQKAKQALDDALEKEQKIVAQAQKDAQGLIKDAKKQAVQLAESIEQSGRETAAKFLEDAHEDIMRERKVMEKELAVSVTRLASDMVQKAVIGILTKEEQVKVAKRVARTSNLAG